MVKNKAVSSGDDDYHIVAVIIAEIFDPCFTPVLSSDSMSLLKIANIEILNYPLEWISRSKIKDVILIASSARENYVQRVAASWNDRFNSITVVSCRNCMSVGDAIREVDSRRLIFSDFILITNTATFCSSDLDLQIERFRDLRKDKTNVMMLLYTPSDNSNSFVGIERRTNKLVLYQKNTCLSQMEIDKRIFLDETCIHRDLKDTGIALCSTDVCTQFSDNFDFEYKDDIIREILVNEEILCRYIYVDVLPNSVAAFTVSDYTDLLSANQLVLQRWFTPLILGKVADSQFFSKRNNIFIQLKNGCECKMEISSTYSTGSNVVFGSGCIVSSSAYIKNSSIGNRSVVGERSRIINCVIGENVNIGDECTVKDAYICDDVVIGFGSSLESRIVIGPKVVFPPKMTLPSDTMLCCERCADDDDKFVCSKHECGYLWKFADDVSFWHQMKNRRRRTGSSIVEKDVFDDTEKCDDGVTKELDGTEKFFEEVKESMERLMGRVCTKQLIRNLILEINSSKLAYNVAMEDVAHHVFKAFISLECISAASIESISREWRSLFLNYYKPLENQVQALIAIEEYLAMTPSFKPLAARVIYIFYEIDVFEEEAILEWYNGLSKKAFIRPVVAPIIKWLQEAEEEDG